MPVRKSKDKEEDVKGHSVRDADKAVRSVRKAVRSNEDDVQGHSVRDADSAVRSVRSVRSVR